MMKVLLVNGSPHKEGCTYTALCEVGDTLNGCGVDADLFWIGNRPLSGCIACHRCSQQNCCVIQDTVNEFLDIAGDYDGFVFGSPVHWVEQPEPLPLSWIVLFMQISTETEIAFT